jgi:hypothetical protein
MNEQDSTSHINGIALPDYLRSLMIKQEQYDASNLHVVDSIVKIYGYPGLSLVGKQPLWLHGLSSSIRLILSHTKDFCGGLQKKGKSLTVYTLKH